MKLYNTLTRRKEEFVPIEDRKVKMYNCGPTVYNFIHVGNARPLVIFDTLRRYFVYKGYDVDFVVNFTDIDDKLITRGEQEGRTVAEIAEEYIEEFKVDAGGLGLYDYETKNPRATGHIQEIVDFISGLVEKNAAYPVNGDVYFDITAAHDYGKLSKKNLDELMSGARIDVNPDKKNPGDFALWKAMKPGEPHWPSPWGEGRPGWHIECSVMAKSLLGETIDIHSGGEDLQFPHHENEIAQSETLTEKPFARYWLHNGMITVDNEKMSKSKGNFFTVREVSQEFDLEVLRFFILSAHYRGPINFSREVMEATKNGLDRLYNVKDRLDRLEENTTGDLRPEEETGVQALEGFRKEFELAMDDDLNTADGVSALFNLGRWLNAHVDEHSSHEMIVQGKKVFLQLSKVLGILRGRGSSVEDCEEIEKLIEERAEARKNRDFQKADEIRDRLLNQGILIEDTSTGTVWKKK